MNIKQNIIDKVNTLREERNMMSYCDAWHMSPETEKLTKKIITMIQYNIFDIDDVCEKNLLPADHLQLLIDDAKQDILAQVSIALEDSERAVLYTNVFLISIKWKWIWDRYVKIQYSNRHWIIR